VHESDLDQVLKRAEEEGVDRLLIVGGHLEDSRDSFEICKLSPNYYCTVGVHPCRANVKKILK
jgi:TatD DNase family protein